MFAKRHVLPRGVVGHLGRHIGSGSLCEDARCLCILSLIGSKIGQSSGRGRCAQRTKLFKLMVRFGRLVDLPLPEMRFGQHQVTLRSRWVDLPARCAPLFRSPQNLRQRH